MIKVSCGCCDTSGCCGVRQLAYFTNDYDRYAAFKGEGATPEEAWQNLLSSIRSYDFSDIDNTHSCSVLQIWFVKKHDYRDVDNEAYEAEPLMELVEQIPGVLCLGEFRNVNSGNLIKGYQWAV